MKYTFRQDETLSQHGWLSVFDEQGNLLATKETWYTLNEYALARLESHVPKPGRMIPLEDPRWYTHCQWCGASVVGHPSWYYSGQYHRECYEHKERGERR